jgi:hypothetical protein
MQLQVLNEYQLKCGEILATRNKLKYSQILEQKLRRKRYPTEGNMATVCQFIKGR